MWVRTRPFCHVNDFAAPDGLAAHDGQASAGAVAIRGSQPRRSGLLGQTPDVVVAERRDFPNGVCAGGDLVITIIANPDDEIVARPFVGDEIDAVGGVSV